MYTIYPETLPVSALTWTIKKIRDRLKTVPARDSRRRRRSRRMHVLSGPLVSYSLRYFDCGSLFGYERVAGAVGGRRLSGS